MLSERPNSEILSGSAITHFKNLELYCSSLNQSYSVSVSVVWIIFSSTKCDAVCWNWKDGVSSKQNSLSKWLFVKHKGIGEALAREPPVHRKSRDVATIFSQGGLSPKHFLLLCLPFLFSPVFPFLSSPIPALFSPLLPILPFRGSIPLNSADWVQNCTLTVY